MTTIASLGLQIDSGDAVEAKDNLDQLTDAGKRSEESAAKTGRAWEGALSSMQGDTRQIVQELQALNAKQAELAQQMATVGRAVTTASNAFSSAAANMTSFRSEAAQAGQAQAALTSATEAGAESGRRAAETTEAQQARLLAMARASMEASDYIQSLNRTTAQNVEVTTQANSVLSDHATRQAAINSRAQALMATEDRLAQSTKTSTQSQREQGEALQDLLGKIDPTVAAMGRLDQMEQKLKGFRSSGALDAESFSEYKSKIDQAREALGGANTALSSTGMTAKATAAALRNVPAQFTDIFVSLQGGQAPLTVLLQQGGQLKDMFGGIGPAARAMGGYVAGLISPFTLAAAAVGVLGLAYYQGSEESEAFAKSLILTGNAAGTTVNQLGETAKAISAVVGTTGQASAALVMLTNTGKVSGENLEQVGRAAVAFSSATGRSIQDVVAEYAELGKDPVEASKRLNAQYGYLTASVYQQITALEAQGQREQAVALAQKALADAQEEMAEKVRDSLGWLEESWKSVASWAKQAWDAMLDIGREDTLQQKIADLTENLEKRRALGWTTEPYEIQLRALQQQLETEEKTTKEKTEQNKRDQAAILGIDLLNSKAEAGLDRQTKKEKELAKIRKARDDALSQPGVDVADIERKYQLSIAGINNSYKPEGGGSKAVDLTSVNDRQNARNAIIEEHKAHQRELDAAQKAGLVSQESYAEQSAAIIEQQASDVAFAYQEEIKALEEAKARSTTTGQQRIQLDQKIADARAGMVKAQKQADSELAVLALNEQGRLKAQERAIGGFIQALDQQQRALELAGQRAVVGVGQGDRKNALSGELNSQGDRYAQQVEALEDQRSDPSRKMSDEEFERKAQALAAANKKATDQIRQNYADVEAAQGDWTKGASAAWENYLDSAQNIAGQTKSLFGNAFSSMEDSIVNFAMTGKASFGDFTKSIIADMARIAARQAASGLLGGLVSMGVSAAASYFGGGANGFEAGSAGATSSSLGASQAGYSSTYFPQALGGAWSGGVQMFADGGAFTNSIVSKPTAFGMANGKTGVMGEAGEEAIMPLTRTSSGKLGVMAVGGGGSGVSLNLSMPIIMSDQEAGRPDGAEFDAETFQRNMETRTRQVAVEEIAKSWRQGGISSRNVKG